MWIPWIQNDIFRNGIHMDPHKVQTIVGWVTLASIWNVQCFFKFINFYRCFIAHYFLIMVFVIRLTRKDQPFLGELRLKCFSIFESFFHNCPILNSCKPFQTFCLRNEHFWLCNTCSFKLGKIIFFVPLTFVLVSFLLKKIITKFMIKNF